MEEQNLVIFYAVAHQNCPPELGNRINNLLGEDIQKFLAFDSQNILHGYYFLHKISQLWMKTENLPIKEIRKQRCFSEAKYRFNEYVNSLSEKINQRQLTLIDRLVCIILLRSCWAFPAVAEDTNLDDFLTLCEKNKNYIFLN